MSTSRASGAGNGGVGQPIPARSRKVVQSLKEIVNCPEAEIYAALKECNMDPNEAVNRLLSQDPFHEVKSKREKKKEGKDLPESRSRGTNSSSNRGSKTGADCQYGRGSSAQYYTSDSSLHGKMTYKKENGSGSYSSVSSVHGGLGNNRSRRPPVPSDGASAESKGSLLGTADGLPPVSQPQPASGYQPTWVGTPGQVSMADIVRMGRPNKKGSNDPNASHNNIQVPIVKESLHTDHSTKVSQLDVPSLQQVPTNDEWPSIENPAAPNLIPVQEHPVDTELHPEAPGVSYGDINHEFEAEEAREGENENFETSAGNDVASVPISSRMIPEDVSRGVSQFETKMYENMGTYETEPHDFDHREVEEVDASITSISRSLQQPSVNKDDRDFLSEANAPSVVIPEHLQVQIADCSHLTFGSFGSAMDAAYSSGTQTSVLEKSNLEEAQNETEESTGGKPETRHMEYYVDESLRNTPNDSLLLRNSATVGTCDASSPQPEEFGPESADLTHGNQYPFPSSSSGYTFDDAQRLDAAFNQTSSQMHSLAPFSNVMHAYTNSLPSSLIAPNVHPTREPDLQYSPFSLTQSLAAKYGNSASSIGDSAISMSEALKTAGLQSSQPAPPTGPPLLQHLASIHPYSQPNLPLGPFANMIGYPFLPQSYTYLPSAFQQPFAGSSNYHQSLAAVLPQYKSGVSVSSLPPQSVAVTSGYGGFGSSSTIPGNFSMNPAAAAAAAAAAGGGGTPSGTSLSYDDVLSNQYKDSAHLLSLQQNDNSTMWPHGNSRTMPAVPASTFYNYQTQNQQPSGFRQVQQQAQNYGSMGYPNFYHPQAGISTDQQQQNPRDESLGVSQGQPKQSQIWPNNY